MAGTEKIGAPGTDVGCKSKVVCDNNIYNDNPRVPSPGALCG